MPLYDLYDAVRLPVSKIQTSDTFSREADAQEGHKHL